MNNAGLFIAVFCIGLLVGWVGRDYSVLSPPSPIAKKDSAVPELAETSTKETLNRLDKQAISLESVLSLDNTDTKALDNNNASTGDLSELLAANRFDEAVRLLGQIERLKPYAFPQARAQVFSRMKTLATQQNDQAFMALIDAYLAVYFKDVSTYLTLAKFRAGQDDVFEAIAVYQQAENFSNSASEKRRVKNEVLAYVEELSQRYERERRQYELAQVYEQLLLTDLDYPEFKFYLADLYLREGYNDSARRLLTALSVLPQWRDKSSALLLGLDNPGQDERDTVQLDLKRQGSHYIAPLQLGYDTQANLMIDTGASMTTISRDRFAIWQDRLSADFVREQTFRTANGLTQGNIYRFASVNFAGFELRDFELAVLDYPAGSGVDGLLGMNVLQRFRFELDQQASQLRLSIP